MSARTLLMAAAAAGPPGASLNLSFMSGTLDPRITFTRASTATYFDATGTMQTAATNAPRFDYNPSTLALNGLLLEDQRTNVLLNSATLGTQSVAVTAQAYTLSFYGTGTITKSGTAAGALVGTGAFPQRVSQTFTPTAGTLTLTVTGSVLNAQLEAGAFPTSYIPVTGAAATRSGDQCGIPPANMGGWFVPPGGSWMAEFIDLTPLASIANSRVVAQWIDGGIAPLFLTNSLGQFDGSGIVSTANTYVPGTIMKGASTYASGSVQVCLNGGAVATGSLTTGYGLMATSGTALLILVPTGVPDSTNGYIRRVRYWPRVLSNTELQSVTR